MNLIENYCNAVVRFLKNKTEIKKEVEEMIYSALEEQYGFKEIYSEEEVVAVLKKLGNPHLLAIRYANLPDHLVGEKYIYQFYYIFAFVLFGVLVANVFAFVFRTVESPAEVFQNLGQFFSGCIVGAVFGFGLQTMIFMGLEIAKKEVNLGNFNPLTLKNEKKILEKAYRYRLFDSIFSIIFGIIFMGFLNLYPEYIALYTSTERIPIFNPEYLQEIIWGINILYLLWVGVNLYKLFKREKTAGNIAAYYLLSLATAIIMTFLIAKTELINPDLITYLMKFEFFFEFWTKYGDVFIPRFFMIVVGFSVLIMTIDFLISLSRILLMKKNQIQK